MEEDSPSLAQIILTLRLPEQWGNFLAHALIFIPGAVFIGVMALRLDRTFRLEPLAGPPWNYLLGGLLLLLGGVIVIYAYGYLYIKGHGSPGPHMGQTITLVQTGIFSLVRHPSVIGKLLGIIGLAVVMRSPSFLLVIVPLLMLYSYATTRLIQERLCRQHLGQAYDDYCRRVPMYLPRLSQVRALMRERRGR